MCEMPVLLARVDSAGTGVADGEPFSSQASLSFTRLPVLSRSLLLFLGYLTSSWSTTSSRESFMTSSSFPLLWSNQARL